VQLACFSCIIVYKLQFTKILLVPAAGMLGLTLSNASFKLLYILLLLGCSVVPAFVL
jgi:hypothetical protein